MKEQDLVDELTGFGLDERSAHVFYHLSRLGSATASELAQATDVQRTEIYRVMDDLEDHGFVEKTLERPRRFVPRPIEEALSGKLEQRRRRVASLEETRDDLVDRWPSVEHEDEARQQRFSVHQGREQIRGLLERMTEHAEDEVLLVGLHRGLGRLDTMGIVDRLAEAGQAGLSVRTLTEVEEGTTDALDRLDEAGELRHLELPGYVQLLIVDTSEIALFVSLDPVVSTQGFGETVLWLNARDFILAQKALFDTLWTTGIPYPERVSEVQTDALADRLEVIRGRWIRYDRVKEMLHRAEERVHLAAPQADVERFGKAGIERALERAADRGVEVSVVAPEAVDLDGVDLEVAARSRLFMLVVDDEEALVGMGVDQDPSSMASEAEWAVWGSLEDLVDEIERLIGGGRARNEQAAKRQETG